MKGALKRILMHLPGGERLLRAHRRRVFLRRFGRKSPEALFTHYYETNEWGDAESVSGPGSTVANTAALRQALPGLLSDLGVKRLLDAPCGDFNWFRLVEPPAGVEYVGGDIVAPLIDRNREAFGGEHVRFVHLDILTDPLPAADLWLCRDCLFHFSYADVFRALGNFAASSIGYLLTSTYLNCRRNIDIMTGDFRPLNLSSPPVNLPRPLRVIEERLDGEVDRQLALWPREAVAAALARRQ